MVDAQRYATKYPFNNAWTTKKTILILIVLKVYFHQEFEQILKKFDDFYFLKFMKESSRCFDTRFLIMSFDYVHKSFT